MSTLDTLAAELAQETLALMDETGQDRLYVEVGELLAASSQTLEEAFLTEIRVRLAARSAGDFLRKMRAGLTRPDAPKAS